MCCIHHHRPRVKTGLRRPAVTTTLLGGTVVLVVLSSNSPTTLSLFSSALSLCCCGKLLVVGFFLHFSISSENRHQNIMALLMRRSCCFFSSSSSSSCSYSSSSSFRRAKAVVVATVNTISGGSFKSRLTSCRRENHQPPRGNNFYIHNNIHINRRRLTRTFASYNEEDDEEDDEEEEEKWSDLLEQFDKEAVMIADRNKKIIIPPHKVATLERALAGGRRTFRLNELANDLGLERRDVTAWMKENQHRQKELAEKYPQEQFRNEDIDEDEVVGLLSNRAKETVRRDKLHDVKAPVNKGKKDGGPGGMPAYKGFKKTRLGASNVATLEKIWETGNHYPDDATIQGIRDATKLPASKIVNWFKEKRDGARSQRHRDARNRQAEKEGFERGGRRREGRGGGEYGKQNHRKQRDVVEDWGDDYE